MRRIETTEDEGFDFLMNTSQRICKENPYIAEFIDAVLVGWRKDPPTNQVYN
ncbi:MAG TPA: hypothetical protein VMV66_00255 [Candidatus Humimicrobiaceae bacterium]|nr:hypothetical protein [Candidatus Humimicrobiaceae bacterium]